MRAIDAGVEETNDHAFPGEACSPKAISAQALDTPRRTSTQARWLRIDRPDETEFWRLVYLAYLRVGLQRRQAAGVHVANDQPEVTVDAHATRDEIFRPLDLGAGRVQCHRRQTFDLRDVRCHEMALHRTFDLRCGGCGARSSILQRRDHLPLADRGQCISDG